MSLPVPPVIASSPVPPSSVSSPPRPEQLVVAAAAVQGVAVRRIGRGRAVVAVDARPRRPCRSECRCPIRRERRPDRSHRRPASGSSTAVAGVEGDVGREVAEAEIGADLLERVAADGQAGRRRFRPRCRCRGRGRVLLETSAVESPDMSRLRPVRVHSMVLPVTTRSTPPPSNQMPRPQEAVPNWPCDVPEMRLSVIGDQAVGDDLGRDRAIVGAVRAAPRSTRRSSR